MDKKQFTTLVPRAQKGDAAAMNELLEHWYQDLYHFAYQTVKDPDLAADITQESCIDILHHLDQLHSPDAFGVWARQITYRQCTRHFRQT
jgi:RNA polymerase sigma factor (sigma-70 family)